MKPLHLMLPLLFVAQMAQATDLFDLTGEWRGNGAIVSEPGQPGREGRCRITAIPLVEGKEIRLKGRCATDQGSAELSMRFVLYPGGILAGGIASSTQPDSIQFDGRLEGDVARLASRKVVDVDGLRGTSNFTLTITDASHFRLRQWLVPEDGSAAVGMVDMAFIRVP